MSVVPNNVFTALSASLRFGNKHQQGGKTKAEMEPREGPYKVPQTHMFVY